MKSGPFPKFSSNAITIRLASASGTLGLDWQRLEGKQVSENSIETAQQVRNVDYTQPFSGGPVDVGFDEYFGISAFLDMVPYVFLKIAR